MPERKQFAVTGRFEFQGTALVYGENEADAIQNFQNGDFEFEYNVAECVNWKKQKIESTD